MDWVSAASCLHWDELNELLKFLHSTDRLTVFPVGQGHSYTVAIAPGGWERLEKLEQTAQASEQCFVAMWFDDSMDRVYDSAIAPGIKAAGYKPFKVNDKEHNGKIDDEIIAQVRRSGLLLADFTGHRGGVYFEAGFAKGLGLEVVWSCKRSELKKLHFDIRQYNCIDWIPEDLEEFSKRITNRILATVGEGPGLGNWGS